MFDAGLSVPDHEGHNCMRKQNLLHLFSCKFCQLIQIKFSTQFVFKETGMILPQESYLQLVLRLLQTDFFQTWHGVGTTRLFILIPAVYGPD